VQHGGAVGFKKLIAILATKLKPNWKVVNLIHDEVIIEVPIEDVTFAKEVVVSSMVDGMKIIVPNVDIKVDVTVNNVWAKE
jgi:DNA polymerase I-like protein with 3'-5' exonuclease and polymerase domains